LYQRAAEYTYGRYGVHNYVPRLQTYPFVFAYDVPTDAKGVYYCALPC
jgi:hypothetical protein